MWLRTLEISGDPEPGVRLYTQLDSVAAEKAPYGGQQLTSLTQFWLSRRWRDGLVRVCVHDAFVIFAVLICAIVVFARYPVISKMPRSQGIYAHQYLTKFCN